MGFQRQICSILRTLRFSWSILVTHCVHRRTSSSKTLMLLVEKNISHKYWLFCYRFNQRLIWPDSGQILHHQYGMSVAESNTTQSLELSKECKRNCIYIPRRTEAGICKCGLGPVFKKDISALKRVQRKAARFCSQNYNRYASVTDMIKDLGWATLETRRRLSRLTLTVFIRISAQSRISAHLK